MNLYVSPRPRRTVFFLSSLALVLTAMLAADVSAVRAAIVGINTPTWSVASIIFDDTNSIGPPAGVTNTGPTVTPWNGSLVSLPLTTDPNTLDQASGDINATFSPGGNVYAVNFSNIFLSQPLATTTGWADLLFNFKVQFQLDAAGLPAGNPVYSPIFNLWGTIMPGGFASFNGVINYRGEIVSGVSQILHIHQYGAGWSTPGAFTATVPGNPLGLTTPALAPNTTLTLDGWFRFRVDPATIQGYTTAVPEPGTGAMALAGGALAGLFRRLFRRCTAK